MAITTHRSKSTSSPYLQFHKATSSIFNSAITLHNHRAQSSCKPEETEREEEKKPRPNSIQPVPIQIRRHPCTNADAAAAQATLPAPSSLHHHHRSMRSIPTKPRQQRRRAQPPQAHALAGVSLLAARKKIENK
jgi:hypothetical protein